MSSIFSSFIFSEQIIHRVNEKDTLFGISIFYHTSVDQIIELNNLQSEIIHKGDELIIPQIDSNQIEVEVKTYSVKRGDTLSEIASTLNIEQKQIMQLNYMENNQIRVGQELIIPGKAAAGGYYYVQNGDNLSKISLLFDISQNQIIQINELTSDILRIGQKIIVAPLRPQIYIVEKGDSLWNISNAFNITVDQLITYNQIKNERILPGQALKMYPYVLEDFEDAPTEPVAVLASYKEETLQEYMNYEDDRQFQPSTSYAETRLGNPEANYKQAIEIMNAFDHQISRERRLSNDLAGYHIVIDPGHGGLDPGAIVSSKNGNDETVYVVEDEYAYDISLRTYRRLKLHGAEVTMTIISPNHQIRSSSNPSETFVNMKNEVYNNLSMNRAGDDSSWPVGNSAGLRKRVDIAESAFKNHVTKNTVFVSIHADNSPDHGQGSMDLYSSELNNTQNRSIELAESLVPFLGASSSARSQNLAVLRDNPAWAEVLIEIRNLHYPGNSWAIRYDKLREQDAEFITAGLISYAANR